MSYTTQQDILDFVEDNNVKFVRFAFCDIFGFQKNIAVLTSDLPKALEDGVCFDGSAIAGFMHMEESDLVLRPDLSTMTILPWRTAEGRVDAVLLRRGKAGQYPFGGNCRGFLRGHQPPVQAAGPALQRRHRVRVLSFRERRPGPSHPHPHRRRRLFRRSAAGRRREHPPGHLPDHGADGPRPQHSHHENGHGQNEIDFHYAGPLKTADNIFLFKQIVRAVAASNGFHSSFLPKPLPDQAGSGLHINLSLTMDGKNLFEGDIAPDSIPGSFMAGILRHSRELTAFTNPLPNSYLRFGCDEAPRYVSWSRQNRSQLVRIPQVKGDNCRMELRSPDPACNPYLAIGLVLAAGLDGIREPDGAVCPCQPQPLHPERSRRSRSRDPARLAGRGRRGGQEQRVPSQIPARRAEPPLLCRGSAPLRGTQERLRPREYERVHYSMPSDAE